jgi:hypothetical protein
MWDFADMRFADPPNLFVICGLETSARPQIRPHNNWCFRVIFVVNIPGGVPPPVICGSNSGQHMYVDSSPDCITMRFATIGVSVLYFSEYSERSTSSSHLWDEQRSAHVCGLQS